MDELTGLENDFFGYGSEEELYEAVQSGEFNIEAAMTDGYREATGESNYAPRPQDYADSEEGYAAYDAALAEWYANTPQDAVTRDADMMLWVVQAYNAGDLSAAEAQEMWDAAYESRYEDYDVDEDGNRVQNFYRDDGTVRNTSTYGRITFGEDDVSSYGDYVSSTQQVNEQFTQGFGGGFRSMMQAVASNPAGALFLGVATGGITSALAGSLASTGLSTAASQALAQGLVNTAMQAAINGEVDFTQALLSAAGGYISAGGLEELKNIMGSEGGLMAGAADYLQQAQDFLEGGLEAVSGGQEWLADTLLYGGADALEQLVTTGSISLEDALTAGLMEGAAPHLAEWAYDQLDEYFDDYTETKWQIRDAETGEVVHEFSDYETARAWADSAGFDPDTGLVDGGFELLEVSNDLPDWIEPIMEAGGESAAALQAVLSDMGMLPNSAPGESDTGDPFYQVIDGVVYKLDYATGEWVPTDMDSDGLDDGLYDDVLRPIEDPTYDFTYDPFEPEDPTTETPTETPPVETPPVETPPTETPPVETPPVETPPTEPVDILGPADMQDFRNQLLDGRFDGEFDGSADGGDTDGDNNEGDNEDASGEEPGDAGDGGGEDGGDGDGNGPGVGGDLGRGSFDPYETQETELYAYSPFAPAPVKAPQISYEQWLRIAQNRGMFG